MEKQPSANLANIKKSKTKIVKKTDVPKETQCSSSGSSSHTQFYVKDKHTFSLRRMTKDTNISESISSTDTYHCYHKGGRKYSPEALLKRNLKKELDPIVVDPTWTEDCILKCDWDIVNQIMFLITDLSALKQLDRLQGYLRDFARLSQDGYMVHIVDRLIMILDYLLDKMHQIPTLRQYVIMLLKNLRKPILLNVMSDTVKYYGYIKDYIEFLGYLLLRVEDNELFHIVSDAILWHLTAPNESRRQDAVKLHHTLLASRPMLVLFTTSLTTVSLHRFPTFLQLALILACDSPENCIKMMMINIVEDIFYRFNPYFPRPLSTREINPADPQDVDIKLGGSSLNFCTTTTLLLVLIKATMDFLQKKPEHRKLLPHPDEYSQHCFVWAYRYECLARDHGHQRITLTTIALGLLKCFGPRLVTFSSQLMADVMSLSVMTEIPKRDDWIGRVNFNTLQVDVEFKKVLINLVVNMLKLFPSNKFMVQSRYWLLGMMYLLDPALGRLKAHWSPSHYDELRRITLQALIITLPICDPKLIKEYDLIKRMLWYIEWYTESPYSITNLYWSLRLLQITVCHTNIDTSETSVNDLYNTHGIIILTNLAYTLLAQKNPPIEKGQAVLAVCLRMLSRAICIDSKRQVVCSVYPFIRWPDIVYPLVKRMMSCIIYSLEKYYYISDRWMIALLSFTWEAILWNNRYREMFIKENGIYRLLDIITMTDPSVQCIALALVCDIIRAGQGVGQMVTWRAGNRASNTNPMLVKRGSTIATLLAAIFREECQGLLSLNEFDVLKDVESLPMTKKLPSSHYQNRVQSFIYQSSPRSECAFDFAGSRQSKVFAILHMLSEDLTLKVDVADETYNMYKNIQLNVNDETVLVLCSHYLTIKLNEAWLEAKAECNGLVIDDELILSDFLQIGKGWTKEIKRLQDDVVVRHQKMERDEENSLYAFLGRIRLNIALDALKNVRCVARSADRRRIAHDLLHDSVFANHRLTVLAKKFNMPVLKTYRTQLDDANITGQNVKVYSILPKDSPGVENHTSSMSSTGGSK